MAKFGYNIFYADDDSEDREIFKEMIADLNEGHNVYTQSSGEELLGILNNPPPTASLVFLDLNMPLKNGYEILKEIRSTEMLRSTPIIILSTSKDKGAVEKAKELGANMYLSKATSYTEFRETIQQVVAKNWDKYVPAEKDFYFNGN